MTVPKYIPGPIDSWLWAAFTVFINGFVSGLGGGAVVGVGAGVSGVATSLHEHPALVAAGSAILAGIGNGLKRVIVWHDSNPFPNPFPPSTP